MAVDLVDRQTARAHEQRRRDLLARHQLVPLLLDLLAERLPQQPLVLVAFDVDAHGLGVGVVAVVGVTRHCGCRHFVNQARDQRRRRQRLGAQARDEASLLGHGGLRCRNVAHVEPHQRIRPLAALEPFPALHGKMAAGFVRQQRLRVVEGQHQQGGGIEFGEAAEQRIAAEQFDLLAGDGEPRTQRGHAVGQFGRGHAEQHASWRSGGQRGRRPGRRHRQRRQSGHGFGPHRSGVRTARDLGREVGHELVEGFEEFVRQHALAVFHALVDVDRFVAPALLVELQPDLVFVRAQLLPGVFLLHRLHRRLGHRHDVQALQKAAVAEAAAEVFELLQAPVGLRIVVVHHDDHRERRGHRRFQRGAEPPGHGRRVVAEEGRRHVLHARSAPQHLFQLARELCDPPVPGGVVIVRVADERAVLAFPNLLHPGTPEIGLSRSSRARTVSNGRFSIVRQYKVSPLARSPFS